MGGKGDTADVIGIDDEIEFLANNGADEAPVVVVAAAGAAALIDDEIVFLHARCF